MPTISDFAGTLVAKAPSATAANNAAGKDVVIQSNHFLSLGPVAVGGTTAQNDQIVVTPKFPCGNKIIKNAVKASGATWTAGQTLYIVAADGTRPRLVGLRRRGHHARWRHGTVRHRTVRRRSGSAVLC
jgi:hypothetical protein